MDPVTLLGIATTSYSVLKKGIAAGKEIESMSGDLGRWMGAIQGIKAQHGKAKSRRFGSVEEEALESFAALKKAEQMENELRNFVIGHYGMNAWQQIIRLQGEIRKRRKEEEIARQQFFDDLIIWGLIAGCIALTLGGIVWLIMAM
jgi:hypothetical protein